MSDAPDLVYLSRSLWDGLYQRPQRLATGLAASYRVLYVDTPLSTFNRRFIKPFYARVPLRPCLWQPEPGLTVLSPGYVPYLPKVWPPPGQYPLSRAFLHWAVRRLGMTNPIVWAEDPRDTFFINGLSPRLLCYDCMDDYSLMGPSPGQQEQLRCQEEALLARADVVFASSRLLAERCRRSSANVVLVPNGVDAERFDSTNVPEPADLAAIGRPRLGFVGALAPWIDSDVLAAVARARPDWAIVLVGPVLGGFEQAASVLRRHRNVHLLGQRSMDDVPAYLANFDCCLIPFRVNDLTRAVNPVKFYEYMAAGRAVVASPLPELLDYAAVCAFAEGGDEFVSRIEAALLVRDDARAVAARREVARRNNWRSRVETVVEAVQQGMLAKGRKQG